MKITITTQINDQQIADLICCALEGGSNYWYMIEEKITPQEFTFIMDGKLINGKHYIADYALSKGGAVIFSSKEEPEKNNLILDRISIKRGLQIMAVKAPIHYGDFLEENTDATTGDIFLQFCLFGEVIYS